MRKELEKLRSKIQLQEEKFLEDRGRDRSNFDIDADLYCLEYSFIKCMYSQESYERNIDEVEAYREGLYFLELFSYFTKLNEDFSKIFNQDKKYLLNANDFNVKGEKIENMINYTVLESMIPFNNSYDTSYSFMRDTYEGLVYFLEKITE